MTPGRSSSTALRWDRWQASPIALEYLSAEARAQGYTLLKFPPQSRETFFTMVDILLARGRFEHNLPHLLEDPSRLSTLAEAQTAWKAWQTWTRRLAAYLERLAAGTDGTLPHVPVLFQDLLDIQGDAQ